MANSIKTVAQLLELEKNQTAELKKQDKVLETLYKRQQGQINSRHQSRARETQLEIDAAEFRAKQSEKDVAQAQKRAGITEKQPEV